MVLFDISQDLAWMEYMELDIHWHIHVKVYYRNFTSNALMIMSLSFCNDKHIGFSRKRVSRILEKERCKENITKWHNVKRLHYEHRLILE